MNKDDEITALKDELIIQKIERLKERMKYQVRHRIQYGELYKIFSESVDEIDKLRAEVYEKTQLLQNYETHKSKKRNLEMMGVHSDYKPPDYWDL
jgi:hypothetical protein